MLKDQKSWLPGDYIKTGQILERIGLNSTDRKKLTRFLKEHTNIRPFKPPGSSDNANHRYSYERALEAVRLYKEWAKEGEQKVDTIATLNERFSKVDIKVNKFIHYNETRFSEINNWQGTYAQKLLPLERVPHRLDTQSKHISQIQFSMQKQIDEQNIVIAELTKRLEDIENDL
jgi:hypothetical protein